MTVNRLEFPPELIESIWEETKQTDSVKFRQDELAVIADNGPLERLSADLFLAVGAKEGQTQADLSVRGFLLGHRVLWNAHGQKTLPPRSLPLIAGYRRLISIENGRLDRDFTRDYKEQGHEAVVNLVTNMIQSPQAQYGAKLIFALYGGLANPNRPHINVPLIEPADMKTSRRRAVYAHRQPSAKRSSR